MGDQGAIHAAPWIYVKISRRAVNAFGGKYQGGFMAHAPKLGGNGYGASFEGDLTGGGVQKQRCNLVEGWYAYFRAFH